MTDRGGRDGNEDAFGAEEKDGRFCFVVCDGLGGHGGGELASALVRDFFVRGFLRAEDAKGFLAKSFAGAQEALMAEQKARGVPDAMKTTAAALVLDGGQACFGHIGDSRLYIFAKNRVLLRTLDHSVPQLLALSGDIREKQIRRHPDRNLLLRVMGIEWEEPRFELGEPLALDDCQAFLLCTDGFWELVDEKTMVRLLKRSRTVQEWCDAMTETVRRNGRGHETDNYTAVAVWC